jgi:hypothetical protein
MAHAKASDLADIAPLLEKIRAMPELKEKSFGCFYYKSKGVLHFHVTKERRFAHVYDAGTWIEVNLERPLSGKTQQTIFKSIKALLSLKES